MHRLFVSAVMAACFLSFNSGVARADEIKLAVGTTALNNIFSKIKAPFEKKTGIKLVYDEKGMGSDKVFKLVDSGAVEGGAGAVPWEEWLELMKSEGYEVKNPKDFKWRVIGGDHIQILSNLDVKVKSLSVDQVRDLLLGKIKSWKELGGADIAPVFFKTSKLAASQRFVESRVLNGAPFRKDTVETPDGFAMRGKVAATPGGFCLAPMGLDDKSVSNIEIEPRITRPLPFITKGTPNENVRKLLRFIVEEGQNYGVVR